VSEGRDDRVEASLGGSSATRGDVDRELTDCLSSIALPSREVLLTLLWSIRVEERRQQQRQMRLDVALVPEKTVFQDKNRTTNQKYILKVKNGARLSRKQRAVQRGSRPATFHH
jgi:transcriptional activator HAC1